MTANKLIILVWCLLLGIGIIASASAKMFSRHGTGVSSPKCLQTSPNSCLQTSPAHTLETST